MIGNHWPCQAILQSEIDKALSPLNELFCAIRNVQISRGSATLGLADTV